MTKTKKLFLRYAITVISIFSVITVSATTDSTFLDIKEIPFTNLSMRIAVKKFVDSINSTHRAGFKYYLTMEVRDNYSSRDTVSVFRIMWSQTPYNIDLKQFPSFYTFYNNIPIVIFRAIKTPVFDLSEEIYFSASSKKKFIQALKPFLDPPTLNYKMVDMNHKTIIFDEYWEGLYLNEVGLALFIVKHRSDSKGGRDYTSSIKESASYNRF